MTALPIEKFASICKRISLNLPSNARWAWDERFNLALVVFEEKDYDLVHMPIILEFEHRWDYFSLPGAFDLLKDHAVNAFGLIPGQEIFTATGTTGDGTFLFATLWPWGGRQPLLTPGRHHLSASRPGDHTLPSGGLAENQQLMPCYKNGQPVQ